MSDDVDHSMGCPVCLDTMTAPIFQCEKGHSVCGECINANTIKKCPLCRSRMTSTRNYQLEDLILKLKDITLKAPCKYAFKGCKYELSLAEKDSHQLECKNRTYKCEGKSFCGWDCKWEGDYIEILKHFKASHQLHCWMEFKTEINMKINMTNNVVDIQAIDFANGQQLFWYKHKTDIKNKKAYWLFQYVGSKKQAALYFYEFEIYDGPTRKLKITEICENDCKDANLIFNTEKCVALSFKTIKNYLNENGELAIRFRIMKMKRESGSCSNVIPCTNPMYSPSVSQHIMKPVVIPLKKEKVPYRKRSKKIGEAS